MDCSNVSKRMVLETVRAGGRVASMVVRRRRFIRSIYTTQVLQILFQKHSPRPIICTLITFFSLFSYTWDWTVNMVYLLKLEYTSVK